MYIDILRECSLHIDVIHIVLIPTNQTLDKCSMSHALVGC